MPRDKVQLIILSFEPLSSKKTIWIANKNLPAVKMFQWNMDRISLESLMETFPLGPFDNKFSSTKLKG